jgi:hypothetical protein
MYSKKIIRYYSDCGRGFWRKQQSIAHDLNCKCWKNPSLKSCLSCKHKNIIKDSNGMEDEPQFLQVWDVNNCKNSESGIPVHKDFEHIRKLCNFYESKK